jgi:hypothetical protein
VQDLHERDRDAKEAEGRVRKRDPAGIRTGWLRPLVIIGIVGVVLIAVRLLVLLITS